MASEMDLASFNWHSSDVGTFGWSRSFGSIHSVSMKDTGPAEKFERSRHGTSTWWKQRGAWSRLSRRRPPREIQHQKFDQSFQHQVLISLALPALPPMFFCSASSLYTIDVQIANPSLFLRFGILELFIV